MRKKPWAKDMIAQIREMALAPKPNISIKIADNLFINKEYDIISLGGDLSEPLYCYAMPKPGKLNTELFEIPKIKENQQIIRISEIEKYPFPKIMTQFLSTCDITKHS